MIILRDYGSSKYNSHEIIRMKMLSTTTGRNQAQKIQES